MCDKIITDISSVLGKQHDIILIKMKVNSEICRPAPSKEV